MSLPVLKSLQTGAYVTGIGNEVCLKISNEARLNLGIFVLSGN